MSGHIPESREQFRLIRAGHELDRAAFLAFLKILSREQHLPALSVGIQHRDADDLRGERPQAHEFGDFLAPGSPGGFVGELIGFAEKIFLLRFVQILER